jgi:uncharacterized protein
MLQRAKRDRRWIVERARKAFGGNSRVVFAYLFGSLARNVATPLSDIDIAVFLSDQLDEVADKLAVLGKLMHNLETDGIDLVVLNTAPLTLKARVVRDGQVLVDRQPHLRHAFESVVLRSYFDFSIFETAILNRRFSLG